jgi:type VI secretion system Hcp family effector
MGGSGGQLGKAVIVHDRINIDSAGWIDIESFSWGVTQTGTTGGGGAGSGKASFSDLAITKRLDKFSPMIARDVAEGRHLREVILEVNAMMRNGTPQTYLEIKMSDVLVTSYQIAGMSGGNQLPMESISFNYGKIEFKYVGPDPADSSRFMCDLVKGTCGGGAA